MILQDSRLSAKILRLYTAALGSRVLLLSALWSASGLERLDSRLSCAVHGMVHGRVAQLRRSGAVRWLSGCGEWCADIGHTYGSHMVGNFINLW